MKNSFILVNIKLTFLVENLGSVFEEKSGMQILLIEDDDNFAKGMEETLSKEGFSIFTTRSGEEGVDLASVYNYQLAIVDMKLPDMAGHDVVKAIRASGKNFPIIILSGMADVEDKVRALQAGADDYVTKPFQRDELISRIWAVVRRSKGHSKSLIKTGKIALNLDSKMVECGSKQIQLTKKEYSMLELLSLRKGVALNKDVFLDYIYGGMDVPDDKIVDVYICKLRKKLTEVTGGEDYIHTIWGQGYMMRDPQSEAND